MRLRRRTRDGAPLERNAVALMVGTIATALVGMLFWTAAARFYSPVDVGRASAVISTAMFLGNVAHLNLGNVYARFLPEAGDRSRLLVRRGVVLAAVVGLVLGSGFVLLWPTGSLFSSGTEAAFFPLSVAVLTVFTVQDSVLVGVRAAGWIPVENLLFAIVKLALLVGLAASLPGAGLVVAWVAPAAGAVVVVLVCLDRLLLPRHMARAEVSDRLPGSRALIAYSAGEFATGLMMNVVPMMLPLIVLANLGSEANAYFAVPWVIVSALTDLTWNVAVSFVVEAANDESNAGALARRSLRLALLVACAGAVVLLAGAPLILDIFGAAYAGHGTGLLRLMALGLPATVVTTVYTSVLRIRRQVGRIVVVQVLIGAVVLALTLGLIGTMGVASVGVAYLGAEGGAGLILLVPLVRSLRQLRLLPQHVPPVNPLGSEYSMSAQSAPPAAVPDSGGSTRPVADRDRPPAQAVRCGRPSPARTDDA